MTKCVQSQFQYNEVSLLPQSNTETVNWNFCWCQWSKDWVHTTFTDVFFFITHSMTESRHWSRAASFPAVVVGQGGARMGHCCQTPTSFSNDERRYPGLVPVVVVTHFSRRWSLLSLPFPQQSWAKIPHGLQKYASVLSPNHYTNGEHACDNLRISVFRAICAMHKFPIWCFMSL